jgi:uncharacterized membrane protein
MTPLVALIIGVLSARVASNFGAEWLEEWPSSLRAGLALMFAVTGAAHFFPSSRRGFIAMVPPGLPWPALLVAVTGVLELAGSAGLLIPSTARSAAACLALLMVLMFPANVSAARRSLVVRGRAVTPLPTRTILQCIFVASAVFAALG